MFLYLVLTVFVLLYLYLWSKSKKAFKYWEDRGVTFDTPKPLFGLWNKDFLMLKSLHEMVKEQYDKHKGLKYYGTFELFRPILIIQDLDLIKHVLVKDFDHFVDRRFTPMGEEERWWNETVLNLRGQEWKNVRNILTPTFSTGKMKIIFENVTGCVENCSRYMKESAKAGKELEMKDAMVRYTADVIATSGFGFQSNSFDDLDAIFPKMANRLVNFTKMGMVFFMLNMAMPFLPRIYSVGLFDKEAYEFFHSIVGDAIKQRSDSSRKWKDFLQLLIDARKENNEDVNGEDGTTSKQILSDTTMFAQAMLFFFAGFETVSTALSFTLYELAVNPDVQDKLAEEVKDVLSKYDNKITYDNIQEMEYLDMVITEATRRHVGAAVIERQCTKDYLLPGTNVTIEKGNMVAILAAGIHMDPEIYPEPERFIPERFSKEEKALRNPYAYLSFGSGPRNCIGMRFAQMEMKAVIADLVTKFRFVPCEKTQIPIKYKAGFAFKAEKDILLKVEERT